MAADTLEKLRAEVDSLTPDNAIARASCALGQLAIKDQYLALQGRMIIGLLVIIMGLGVGLVFENNRTLKKVEDIRQLQGQKKELEQKNEELSILAKPMLDRMTRGASYIHSTYKVPKETAEYYSKIIMENAIKKDISFSLAMTIVGKECSFNCRESYNGSSHGLAQVNCYYHCKEYGVTKQDLWKPEVSVAIGFDIFYKYRQLVGGSTFAALERYSGSEDPAYNYEYASDMLRRERMVRRILDTQA